MTDYLKLKKSNCKNCYKCIRHCPVKSIRFSANQAHIVNDECILCGQCFVVCPQNAKEIKNDLEKAKMFLALSDTTPVVASLAPSFAANYDGATISSITTALKSIGFSGVEETAIGATMVKKQYEDLITSPSPQSVIISSCCPSVNLMIQKHFPEALKYLARIVTPMHAHCLDIKRRYNNNVKTIFIGPCISKKYEADQTKGAVDCVITFEELTQLLKDSNVTSISNQTSPHNFTPNTRARIFPTSGGIIKTMDKTQDSNYSYLSVDGAENCITALKDVIDGKISNCFLEMSSCTGSCIGGPVMDLNQQKRSPVKDYIAIDKYAGSQDFIVNLDESALKLDYPYIGVNNQIPGTNAIKEILAQMGKTKPEHELNCGTCGYNTCREKAIAVYQSKADLNMCLPFLKERAESFSDSIINNTPNGIIVLNESLEVQQINKAAQKIMNIRLSSDILGDQVVRILDPKDFLDVLDSGQSIHDKKLYLAEYDRYVEETIIYERSYHIIMCIMRDVTDEEFAHSKKEKISRQTIEITDKVVEKQMRVVQEIASLLGETTAETKIALTKLKESLNDE